MSAQGTNLEKNYSKEIELTASKEDVWHLLSDVSMWKQWDDHIIDARLVGDFTDKAKGSLVTANSKVVDFYVVDLEQGESYTLRHKLSSGTIYLRRTITSTATATKLTSEVWYKGLSTKNFKKYMGNDYATVLEKELESLQSLLEN